MSGSSRDVVQAGNISGGVHFHRRDESSPPVPRQPPASFPGFVDRTDDLDRLSAEESGVHIITGTAGAGKTSLALRWAHRVKDRFPDGQLHINLRGYDPGEPVAAHEALRRFLTALGVPPRAVPADTDPAAGPYRSLLADRRVLVVLDNAASPSQVRPLLPGSTGCLTIVTSRSRLSGLSIREGAHRPTLGTLPAPEAVALLRAATVGHREGDDDAHLAELARLCAHLPLALRIAGEKAASHPHRPLGDLIADLRDESALWDALSAGEGDRAAEAQLLTNLGMAYVESNRWAESRSCHEEALVVRRGLRDRRGEGDTLDLLGLVALHQRLLPEALRRFEQAHAIFREIGAARPEATALANLAAAYHRSGHPAEATTFALRALTAHRALGNRNGEGNALRILSDLQRESGDADAALRTARQAVEIALDPRNHALEAVWLLTLAAAQRMNRTEALRARLRNAAPGD
ncbi:tetratricopeptide repeat protein [Streptomyces sp. PT12]|uniref:tetratricopeptide repeat protein n=1 Tax=Streptomyces sp. PT12 TaxID=1510197 RepID=UPI000DE54187|nr:tetratricopeptide repeat protein [Streptomyces sp. PT12]RBM17767.1 hypothetical protein DEH69_13850 [Streptomyces sp. PT12]